MTTAARAAVSDAALIVHGGLRNAWSTALLLRFHAEKEDIFGPIRFTGQITGDVINFAWTLQPAAPGALENNPIFGPSAPRRFTAKRVADGNLAKSALEASSVVPGSSRPQSTFSSET